MPFIHIRTNQTIQADKDKILKETLGEAIKIIPGKSEQWLMLSFTENSRMYFRGENQLPIAFVEVKIYGKATAQVYQQMTAEITQILFETLAIPKAQIYIKYEEVAYWGFNGTNF